MMMGMVYVRMLEALSTRSKTSKIKNACLQSFINKLKKWFLSSAG